MGAGRNFFLPALLRRVEEGLSYEKQQLCQSVSEARSFFEKDE
jgi:hypothetical protein